jgi:hypothetical protein
MMTRVMQHTAYPQAWTGATIRSPDWQLPIPAACLAELRAALRIIQAKPAPAETWRAADFDLAACQAMMETARTMLEDGAGLVRFDRLPVDECATVEEAKALYWLTSMLLAEPQPQYFERHMIYDLRFTGVHEDDNEQAHRVKTDEIEPHSDESLPDIGPRYVGLFCWRKAKTGGATRLFSFIEAYNQLLATDPASAERLAEPYFWLPERKMPDGEIYYHPVITTIDGKLRFQFSKDYNWRGYKKWGETFDDAGRKALDALTAALTQTMFEFILEPGQFAIFNNDTVAHGRSFHTDWAETDLKRHVLRLWLGQSGAAYPIPDALRARLLTRQAA